MAHPDPQYRRGVIMVSAATVVWSSAGVLARMVDIDPWTTLFWRSVYATIALSLYLLWRDGRAVPAGFARLGRAGVAMGVCFAVSMIAFIYGLSVTSVATALVFQAAAPLLAAALAFGFLGERVTAGCADHGGDRFGAADRWHNDGALRDDVGVGRADGAAGVVRHIPDGARVDPVHHRGAADPGGGCRVAERAGDGAGAGRGMGRLRRAARNEHAAGWRHRDRGSGGSGDRGAEERLESDPPFLAVPPNVLRL